MLFAHLFSDRWFRVGLGLMVFGWGPLFAIIALDSLGLWPDPNPNPIGPGLLFFVTSWPAVICLGVGAARAAWRTLSGAPPPTR